MNTDTSSVQISCASVCVSQLPVWEDLTLETSVPEADHTVLLPSNHLYSLRFCHGKKAGLLE